MNWDVVLGILETSWEVAVTLFRFALVGWFVFKLVLIVHAAERILTRKNREQEKEGRK